MRYQVLESVTTYLVFYSRKSSNIEPIKRRLSRLWHNPSRDRSRALSYSDTLMLHCMVAHELIQNQRSHLNRRQSRLNLVLNEIREHIGDISRREKLKEFTVALNEIAQDLDVHTYSLERILKNFQVLSGCHRRLISTLRPSDGGKSQDLLAESIERLRLLVELDGSKLSDLKSRRETGMNLVSSR